MSNKLRVLIFCYAIYSVILIIIMQNIIMKYKTPKIIIYLTILIIIMTISFEKISTYIFDMMENFNTSSVFENFNSTSVNILDFSISENRKFPFRYFQDENNKYVPIVALTAFFRSDDDKQLYYKYIENGINIIGITAYKSFPQKIIDISEDKYHITDDFDYLKNINNWLCCFKNKEYYGFNDKHNIIDISESDFYDSENDVNNTEKKYDFIYVCNKDDDQCSITGWNSINRNYELALKCFPIMINKYKLKGLAVGRIGCNLEKLYGSSLETTDFLDWFDLQNKMKQSKFLFVPNIFDASPRVVSECLIKNVPILMNKNILCGTKYITEETGVLFESEKDIEKALDNLLNKIKNNTINPNEWWIKKYGKDKSSTKLRNYLYEIYPKILKNINKIYFIM
jgi:hypothetical protein